MSQRHTHANMNLTLTLTITLDSRLFKYSNSFEPSNLKLQKFNSCMYNIMCMSAGVQPYGNKVQLIASVHVSYGKEEHLFDLNGPVVATVSEHEVNHFPTQLWPWAHDARQLVQ